MKVLDLFSGIGGFSLGLERAGMMTTMFCEIEPYPQSILRKHWPEVPIHDDIRTLTGASVGNVDVICGGFPCQDISVAGKGSGLTGERSGLWSEYARLISEIRPAWVIIENVPALRSRGLDQILGEIAAFGYDAEWHCIPAAALGAPHRRDRIWLIAYSDGARWRRIEPERKTDCRDTDAGRDGENGALDALMAYAGGTGLSGAEQPYGRQPLITSADIRRAASECGWRRAKPGVGRVDDGVPFRLDRKRPVEDWEGNTPRTVGRGSVNRRPRLKALGNSIVPQIAELIGKAIINRIEEQKQNLEAEND